MIGEINEIAPDVASNGLRTKVASTENWIDLQVSDDGQYLYQAFGETGAVGVYEIDGGSLTLVEVMTAPQEL